MPLGLNLISSHESHPCTDFSPDHSMLFHYITDCDWSGDLHKLVAWSLGARADYRTAPGAKSPALSGEKLAHIYGAYPPD